jgi:hypothetical protein
MGTSTGGRVRNPNDAPVWEEENSMSKKSFVRMMTAAAIVAAVGAGPIAFAKSKPPTPSGDMNLRFQGYELAGTQQVSINGIGQLSVNISGVITSGVETFTAVNPLTPEDDVCTGSVTGTITAPTGSFGSDTGEFTISLTYTPSASLASLCFASTSDLTCNRTLVHKNLADDLNAGQYHCVVTGLTESPSTPIGASMDAHIDIVSGNNAPQS